MCCTSNFVKKECTVFLLAIFFKQLAYFLYWNLIHIIEKHLLHANHTRVSFDECSFVRIYSAYTTYYNFKIVVSRLVYEGWVSNLTVYLHQIWHCASDTPHSSESTSSMRCSQNEQIHRLGVSTSLWFWRSVF